MNVPIPFSGFDRYGRCTSQLSTAHYYDPNSTQNPSVPQPIPPLSLPDVFWTQEKYVAVAVVVVYTGGIQLNHHVHRIPMVARVSIVDYRGSVILDTYVRPTHQIDDYRPQETGLQYNNLMNAPHFQDVQLRVANVIKNRVIVGHSLWNFLSVLGLSHPALDTRDLALFRALRKKLKSRCVVSLPTLVHLYMGRNVGMEYEDSVELSRASMDLFRCCEQIFEKVVLDGAWPCNLPPETFAGTASGSILKVFMDNQALLPDPSAVPNHIGRASYYPEQTIQEPSLQLPLGDHNNWYYPSHGYDTEEETLEAGSRGGNWGNKTVKGARWVRRGKITPWGPAMDDWEAEERARKRIKLLLPQERRSPSPLTLPHLQRSPSPPLVSPYPPPDPQHLSYASFVMEKSITHTFRSKLLDELEHATNGLIEGEATMKRALGRLWQVMSEDPDEESGDSSVVPKREDEDGGTEDADRARRLARAPDLTPPMHKLFLLSYPPGAPPGFEPSHFSSPEMQLESLEKSLATLRELQDDGREYVERLEEIREGLGDIRAQRDGIWDLVRERAVKELHEVALNATG